jgi:hypothetical protein
LKPLALTECRKPRLWRTEILEPLVEDQAEEEVRNAETNEAPEVAPEAEPDKTPALRPEDEEEDAQRDKDKEHGAEVELRRYGELQVEQLSQGTWRTTRTTIPSSGS